MNVYQERTHHIANTLLGLIPVPAGRRFQRWMFSRREYRGKERFVIGYEWSRSGSHFMKGLVYDTVLGWGENFDQALEHAYQRAIAKAEGK